MDKSFVRFFWERWGIQSVHFGYILLSIILHAPEWWLRNPVIEEKNPYDSSSRMKSKRRQAE